MISSLNSTISNNNHSIDDDSNPLSSMDTKINLEETMSISINDIQTKNDQQKINKDNTETVSVAVVAAEEEDENDDADETSQLVSIKIEDNQEQTSVITLRSILRKRNEKKLANESYRHMQHTSITMDEEVSDYTGDENDDEEEENDEQNDEEDEEESKGSSKSLEEKSKNNEQEQHQQRSYNYSRHQRKNQFFRTSPSTPLDFPLSAETGTATTTTTTSSSFQPTISPTDQSLIRTSCVTFTKDQPIIIHRSSSTPQLTGLDNQPRTSITYINMREDLSTTIPITTTANTSSEFRPVYVSPLKYRPLVGLSANDNRLLLEKRVSLLGRPLVFHPIQKRSPNYRRSQLHIYNFLERPHGCKAVIYHTFVFLTVFLCLFLSVVVTMPEYESLASTFLLQTEILVVIWLTIELGLRVWSAGCRSRYQTLMGRLRFMKKPFCALDFIVILATFITLCLNSRGGNGVFAASALRGLRFFQILRMLRMDRRGGTWKLLGSVVYAHRQELITTIYIGFLVLIFSSFIMFLVEKDSYVESKDGLNNNISNIMTAASITNIIDTDRHKFETFADALWWGIITLCTVGYGDKVPSSYLGKLIAAICSFIGISFFALPAGILGSGFALKVQQQQRQKHYKRRKIPAVLLIQNLWRVYAADEKSLSKATWKVHVRPPRKGTNASTISNSQNQLGSFRIRHNQSFLNRVSFRRRVPTREPVPNPTIVPNAMNNTNIKSMANSTISAMRTCIDTFSDTTTMTPSASILTPHEGSSSDNEDDRLYYANDVSSLKTTHRNAIRFIRKIKYFVSRRKFREALRPYDVTDVIEQYSTGNVDMLARMKYLQARLDKVLGISKSVDSYESGPSLASRICKIERQVDNLDLKVDKLCQLANGILEHQIQRETSTSPPTSLTPIVKAPLRSAYHFPLFRRRRWRRRNLPRNPIQTTLVLSQPPTPILTSTTETVVSRSSTTSSSSTSASTRDDSCESPVSLYWLFQDNINTSRTHTV